MPWLQIFNMAMLRVDIVAALAGEAFVRTSPAEDFGNAGKVASAADHIFKSIHDKVGTRSPQACSSSETIAFILCQEGIQVTQRLKETR